MIRLEHIHLQFADRTLLEDECLCLREGRVHVLMGRSGSGKTTLLNEIALNGSGQSLVYEWNGIEVSALREEKKAQLRRAQIGYVMQDLEVIDSRLTLEENLKCVCALAGRAYDRQEAEQTMRMLRLDMDLNKRIETLSRGERQRFALLSVLQKGAQLIVCDEPTSALDKENARLFLQLLKETAISRRKIVVIATHDDLVREIADEISFIRQGHLVHEQVRGYSEEQACLQTPFSEQAISPVFYRICARRTRGVREMAAIALMVLIMTMLSVLGPLLRSMNIDERHAQLQEELYLILCNTKEPIPDVTFVNNAALFSDAQIQLLEHIEGAGEVSAYWECSVVGHDDLIVIPDRHIRDIEIPAVLEGEQEMTIQMEMAGRYILSVVDLSHARVIQGTTVKIPEDELAALLAEQGVSGSSSLMVSVDEGTDLDELQDEIGRWMPGVSIQAGNEQALQQQEFMLMLQQSLPLISALIFALSFGVSVMIKLMRAKEEQKRDELLWLHGLGQRERTRLSIVENARKAGLALCSSLLITAGILAAVSALDLWNIGKAMIISLGYLLVTEAAAELLRVLVIRHRRS